VKTSLFSVHRDGAKSLQCLRKKPTAWLGLHIRLSVYEKIMVAFSKSSFIAQYRQWRGCTRQPKRGADKSASGWQKIRR